LCFNVPLLFTQVAPAQRPLPPTSSTSSSLQPSKSGGAAVDTEGGVVPRSSAGPSLAVPDDMRRSQPSPRGASGRGGRGGMPAVGRGGHHAGPSHFPRPGSSGGMMPGNKPGMMSGPSGLGVGSGPPNRPDLQKLGLKFGGQISITSTGNQQQGGKRGGSGGPGGGGGQGGPGVDAQGVSITKLKGDMPVGSPVSIRDATNKQGGSSSSASRPDQQDGANIIKV
jgi:hypothetical protein